MWDFSLSRSDKVVMSLEREQKRIMQHNETIQRLKSRVNDLSADRLKIQAGVQEKCKLEEQKTSLSEQTSDLQKQYDVCCVPQIKPNEIKPNGTSIIVAR